jgi:tetratricopeptide (TPR) repeat protein
MGALERSTEATATFRWSAEMGPFRKRLIRLLTRATEYVTEATPDNAYRFVRRGWLRARIGDFEDAVADFSTALELVPTYGDAYRLRAWAFLKMERYECALDDIEEDLRLRPENAETRTTYGDVLRAMGRDAEALAEYERALAWDSDSASAFIGRAYLRYRNDDWPNAIADFRRGMALGWKDEEARACLAEAEKRLGNACG